MKHFSPTAFRKFYKVLFYKRLTGNTIEVDALFDVYETMLFVNDLSVFSEPSSVPNSISLVPPVRFIPIFDYWTQVYPLLVLRRNAPPFLNDDVFYSVAHPCASDIPYEYGCPYYSILDFSAFVSLVFDDTLALAD